MNEKGLWAAVITKAVEDAEKLSSSALYPLRSAITAYEWLTLPNNMNRKLVCEMAGVSSTRLTEIAEKKFGHLIEDARFKYKVLLVKERNRSGKEKRGSGTPKP